MDFKSAYSAMRDGKKVKRTRWGGYWEWDEQRQTIMMHCTPDNILPREEVEAAVIYMPVDGVRMMHYALDIRSTSRVSYTMHNILCDDWEIATPINCALLRVA